MILCICLIFMGVFGVDLIRGECVPQNSLRVVDREMRLYGRHALTCWIDNVCQNSQSFIAHKCDINGDNCQKMFAYFFTNDSVSKFASTNSSIDTYYRKDLFFDFKLTNVQTADDGIWKIFIRSTRTHLECVNINVTTYVRPKTGMHIIPVNVPTYKKFNLTCLVTEIRPAYRLHFEINNLQFRTGIQIDTPNGDTWNISYSVELVLSPNYPLTASCYINYNDYPLWFPHDDWVYSDAIVINPIEENPLIFHPSQKAVIGCAIPMNFTFIGWTKNNIAVLESHVFTETRISDVRGFIDVTKPDASTVQYSELRFIIPSLDQGCGPINDYIGVFGCEAINTELGDGYKSASRHVVVEYAPSLESTQSKRYDLLTRLGANVILVCPLYSYPPVKEYTWLKGNIQVGYERTLMITHVTGSGFGQYSCIATNTNGSANVTINVIKIVGIKSNLYQANINEQVTLECPLCDGREEQCKWEFRDKETQHQGRVYSIETLTKSDYGKYLCTAIYSSGRTWMLIELVNPGLFSIRSTVVEGTADGMTDRSTLGDIQVPDYQDILHFPTEIIAGFTVAGTVVVGMIVAITVLSCILQRRHKSRDNNTSEISPDAETSEESPHLYEKINLAYVSNNQ